MKRGNREVASQIWLDTPPGGGTNFVREGYGGAMRKMTLWCVFISLATIVPCVGSTNTSRPIDTASVSVGDALIGVSELGNVLVAVDRLPRDGFVDDFFVFAPPYRITTALNKRLTNAAVIFKQRALSVVSNRDRFFGYFQLSDVSSPVPHGSGSFERLVFTDGAQLTHYPDTSASVRLATLSVEDEYSGWPEGAFYDMLDPNTDCGFVGQCQSGGPGAGSCSVSGCPNPPTQCSVQCSSGFFACCNCFGPANCRCIKCVPL